MNKNNYNARDLRSYLLGTAHAEEAEIMDELSVADTEFAELINVAEKDLVDTYVQGELDGDDLRRFEAYYLASPRRREKVRFARSFQAYAQLNFEDGVSSDVSTVAPKGAVSAFLSRWIFEESRPAFKFAMAAAVLLLVTLGLWTLLRNPSERVSGDEVASNVAANTIEPISQQSPITEIVEVPVDKKAASGPTPQRTATPKVMADRQPRTLIASFVLSPPLRGTDVPRLSIPAETEKAAIRLELEADDYRSYSVELKDGASGRIIWRSGRLGVSASKGSRSVKLLIPARSLKSTIYSFTLSGISADGKSEVISDYTFRVVR